MKNRLLPRVIFVLLTLALASPYAGARAQTAGEAGIETTAQRQPQQIQTDPIPQERSNPRAVSVPHELSPWSMFLGADIIVKGIMAGLAFASLVTWTIFLAKMAEVGFARRRLRSALEKIATTPSLASARALLDGEGSVLSSFIAAAALEQRMSADAPGESGIRERAASCFSEIAKAEASAVRRGMGVLATIGATAPFVGLFGTVWGIMNSFIGISKSQTTNLAVVAPGIAEALLATAIGLVAAIPAVVIYNYFSRTTRSYLDLVGRASGAAGRLLSRDLDRAPNQPLTRAEN